MIGLGKKEEVAQTQQQSEQSNVMPFYQSGEELGKEMISSAEIIEKIRMSLLGFIVENGEYVPKGKKLMNDAGASTIAIILESHIGKEVYLTKITDEDKVRIMHDLWGTLIRLLITHKVAWELSDDQGEWRTIRKIVINQTYFALCRGVDGTEKGFFENTHQSKTVMNQTGLQRQPQGGFFQ